MIEEVLFFLSFFFFLEQKSILLKGQALPLHFCNIAEKDNFYLMGLN